MVERTAFRAGFGAAFIVPAMMADQLAAEAMLDQPGRTDRAAETVAADPAQRQRRIAAPVEEQQRLFLSLQRVSHLVDQQRRQEAAARRRCAPHVDCLQIGKGGLGKARRKHRPAVATLLCIDPAFDRRRRRCQHHRKAADMAAHHRHVARIVEDAVLLLVGGVVFFVDDDQAELPERQEQRRTRAGDNANATFRH